MQPLLRTVCNVMLMDIPIHQTPVQDAIRRITTRRPSLIMLHRNFLQHVKRAIRQVPGFLLHSTILLFILSLVPIQQLLVTCAIQPDISIPRIPVPAVTPLITIKQPIRTIMLVVFLLIVLPVILLIPAGNLLLTRQIIQNFRGLMFR